MDPEKLSTPFLPFPLSLACETTGAQRLSFFPLDGLQADREADGTEGVDEDMIVTQSQTNFICPITQVPCLPSSPERKSSSLQRGRTFLFDFTLGV